MSESRFVVLHTGMAGAVALAAGSASYGSIIVVAPPANLPNVAGPGTAGPLNWDVNGDSVIDFNFTFRNPQTATGSGVIWQANMNIAPAGVTAGNAVVGYLGPFVNYATNLSAGQTIGPVLGPPPGASFRNVAQVVLGSVYRSNGVPSDYGGFRPGNPNPGGATPGAQRGFVGFRFSIGGLIRYGWLDVEVLPATGAAGSGGINFFGAAYEDSGGSIPAGAVPAPGALAALAVGAAAMMRRKREEAAA
jgi:MYXO-CTERM domain-containing protein